MVAIELVEYWAVVLELALVVVVVLSVGTFEKI